MLELHLIILIQIIIMIKYLQKDQIIFKIHLYIIINIIIQKCFKIDFLNLDI